MCIECYFFLSHLHTNSILQMYNEGTKEVQDDVHIKKFTEKPCAQ